MLIFIFLAMNVKYCLTINPVMWFRFMGEDFNILPAWHVDQSVKEGANKQVISSQADSLIKISRSWADFFPANTSNQPV